ncbi:hypothetical protein L1987_39120 [Smallanthus sonchifolius]|uniref:Uncharacterized protein n=1 Tax=Smallanthus sonchifolius TaxID=185202 RepID=A0ACB9HKI3_9ASTR|nr:hypothetical protein L1987_39120 [Smallanthus sonchifolius]
MTIKFLALPLLSTIITIELLAPQRLHISAPTGVVMKNENPGFRFTPKVQPLRGCLPSAYMEREFWLEMTRGKKGTVEYGVNVDGSAFSSSSDDHLANSNWNLKGVTDPMLYIGMLFSMFAWHVEDHYLYSINYHHCGVPKTWYGVPSSAAHEFEKVIQHHVYTREILSTNGPEGAFEMLAGKTTMFSPKILLQNHVPVYKLVQLPGEFVGTFPRAYHAGFSHGFNCGEAVNFAAHDWFPYGGAANERYAFLQKKPIIPYEEILCKEAMLLSSKSPKKDYTRDPDADSNRFIKGPFASLIHKYDNAMSYLKSLDRSLSILSYLKETVSCSLCKRDCYVAHVNCNCRVDPICVFHNKELSDCCLSFLGHKGGLGGVEYVDTKILQSNASAKESKRARKQRTCTNGKVDVATPVNRPGKRGKFGISPRMRSGGRRLKKVSKKGGKRAS